MSEVTDGIGFKMMNGEVQYEKERLITCLNNGPSHTDTYRYRWQMHILQYVNISLEPIRKWTALNLIKWLC